MNSKTDKKTERKAVRWICSVAKKHTFSIALVSLIAITSAVLSIVLALISKDVVDVATGQKNGRLLYYGIALMSVVMIQIFLSAVSIFATAYTGGKLTIAIRERLFVKISRRKYDGISAYHSGDIMNRLTSDADVIVSCINNFLPSLFSMVTRIVGGTWALLVLDKRLCLVVLIGGLSVPAFGRLITKKYRVLHKQCQETEGKSRSFMQECFENMVVVKTFISEQPLLKKLNQLLRINYRKKIQRSGMSIVTNLGMSGLFTLGYYGVMIWGASQLSKNAISYGTLLAFLQLVSRLSAPLQNISGLLPQYFAAVASAERLMELENGEYDTAPLEEEELSRLRNDFRYIEADGVKFSYVKDENILDGCSFRADRGKITAITGESGSGKSTVFKIILGLYRPEKGRITVNGEQELNASMRGLFAYVPQGNLLLSGTVRENLTLCDDSISDDRITEAMKTAEIYDYISSLPEGVNTVLSERGAGLSEGQIQRISIARALLTEAPVLLLDEATSALDEATETKVLGNIKQLSDKTVIFVTHRNTSIKVCDKIIHVEDKKFRVVKE